MPQNRSFRCGCRQDDTGWEIEPISNEQLAMSNEGLLKSEEGGHER